MTIETDREWDSGELFRKLVSGAGFFLLDVRSPDQFARSRIDSGNTAKIRNVPFAEVPALFAPGAPALPQPLVAICNRGASSGRVVEALRAHDIPAINFTGGMQAWAKHYEIRCAVERPHYSVFQVSRPARGCLSYIVVSGTSALLVDPLRHAEHYLNFCREHALEITGVIDTHGHADHISSGPALARGAGVPYYLHPDDAVHPIDGTVGTVSFEPLADGKIIRCGTVELEILHVPGHTLGNCALRIGDDVLIGSDTIFFDSISRPDLGGQSESWSRLHYHSLERLIRLPASLTVLPGHFSSIAQADRSGVFSARLGDILNANKSLAELAEGEEKFVSEILRTGMVIPPQYVEIKRINIGLKGASENIADELETGKNQCAVA